MAVFRGAALAASISLACLPSVSQASACWYPEEARAAQVRGLQTMLMVGTLQCRHRSRDSEYLYTDFIMNQRGTLDANNSILKARFNREAGSYGGQGAYDRFATSLANRYSERLDDPGFCATVHRLAWDAARARPRELLRLADAVAAPPLTGQCRPALDRWETAARGYGEHSRSFEAPRIAVADAAEAAPVMAPAPVEMAAVAPAIAVDPAPPAKMERVMEVASAAVPPAPAIGEAMVQAAAQIEAPAAADRDEALKTALIALESALSALQAATASMPAEAAPVAAAEPTGAVDVDAGAADPGVATNTYVPASSR